MPHRRKQERAEQTRVQILDSALRQFSERGFEAVGLRDIAEAAGVTHGLIRYHFGGKDALWREAAVYLFARMRSELDLAAHPEGLSARDRLERFSREYVRYCARHPEHARFMVQESNGDSERTRWLAENLVKPQHGRFLPLIEDLVADGTLPDVDPVLAIYLMAALAQVPYLLAAEMRYVHGRDPSTEEAIAAHADAVVAFLFGQRSARAPVSGDD